MTPQNTAQDEPVIPPIGPGEERLIQVVHRPDGNRNMIYLTARRPSDQATSGANRPINFVAIIRSTDDDPSSTEPPWAWQRGQTERDIYLAVAEAFANTGIQPGHRVELDEALMWFVDNMGGRW